jgi:hypothetical protein
MTQDNSDVMVNIIADDIQAVMNSNPMVALQMQNRALTRTLGEVQGEIERLRKELEESKYGRTDKEPSNADSTR